MSAGWFTAREERPASSDTPASPRRKWLAAMISRTSGAESMADAVRGRLEVPSRTHKRPASFLGLPAEDDKGLFRQWLEGPVEGLRRAWRSIREDGPRPQMKLLAHAPAPVRFLGTWPLKMVHGRQAGDGERGLASQSAPALADSLGHRGEAANSAGMSADKVSPLRPVLAALIDETVIPRLAAAHPAARRGLAADPRSAELARLLFATEASDAYELIDLLRADLDSIESLCAELFEPVARTMGDLWRTDNCSEFDVTLGLGRLQLALHRCSAHDAAGVRPGSAGRAVLLAPSPHEPHLLGSAVAVELFWRAGWDVSCEFPTSSDALNQRLHEHWFDALDLSLSSAFTREHRLESLAATIRAARAHSLNPALAVIVDGRVFHEQPLACAAVGADASCSCALELLPAVERHLSRARLH